VVEKDGNFKVRRAARVDSNHAEIVACFRKLGWSVLDISQLKNCADIIAARDGITFVIEIKDGTKPPSARKLTAGEQSFKDRWRGRYALIQSIGDVLMLNSQNFESVN
jgi:hypothetical protein